MDAVIPAAGEGTRLRPLTEDKPKPLVAVAGRPLLAHVFDALEPVDPDRYVVVVGYRGDAIVEHFGDGYRGTPVEYVRQDEPCGLADAVAQAESAIDGDFLVCNGDNVFPTGVPLTDEPNGAATLLVERASRERAKTTGVVYTDEHGRVSRVVEKPATPETTLVSAGVFALTPEIFRAVEHIEPSARGEYELADAINWLLDRGRRVETVHFDGRRVNVNTPADIDAAGRLLANER